MSMPIYCFDEIKAAGDCVAFMEQRLGQRPVGRKDATWTRFNCPWRPGSDSEAFAVSEKGWVDHVTKEKGSLLDLCAKALYSDDLFQAQEDLGKWLNLKPKMKARNAKSESVVATYDYEDIEGALVFQVVRYEPKNFRQRRPDPESPNVWVWDLKGVETVPYRLPKWGGGKSAWVAIAEGEKDADSLATLGIPATTVPMGAGKWRKSYGKWFKGLKVAIFPDNDTAGVEHTERLTWELRETAQELRVVAVPAPHKDVSDWIAAGADRETIMAALKNAPMIDLATIRAPDKALLSDAKKANALCFRNYVWQDPEGDANSKKPTKHPRHINEMREDLFRRFHGFPRRFGGLLFDHDRATRKVRFIEKTSSLLAWVTEKSGHPVEWGKFEGCVSMEQFFESVHANAMPYVGISGVPHVPPRPEVYYTHDELPAPSAGGQWIAELMRFFRPSTPEDAILIKTLFATPLWYQPGEHRPLFVIDSPDGRGVGKSTIIGALAMLYGEDDPSLCAPIVTRQKDLTDPSLMDRVIRRMMASDSRRKRVFLVDNVTGFFDSAMLASLTTQMVLSGMAPYGRDEETRPNDLTFCLTSNSATLGNDLINRGIFIDIRRPGGLGGESIALDQWKTALLNFVREKRMHIIADYKHLLEKGSHVTFQPTSRVAAWERAVLMPCCPSLTVFSGVWKQQYDRKTVADGDSEEAEAIRAVFRKRLGELCLDPDKSAVWIRSDVLKRWSTEAVSGFGGRDGRGATHALRNMAKDGLIPELSAIPTTYPHNGPDKTRGMMWHYDLAQDADWSGHVYEVSVTGADYSTRALD